MEIPDMANGNPRRYMKKIAGKKCVGRKHSDFGRRMKPATKIRTTRKMKTWMLSARCEADSGLCIKWLKNMEVRFGLLTLRYRYCMVNSCGMTRVRMAAWNATRAR